MTLTMTKQQIIDKAKELGLSNTYPLRGNKQQIITQCIRWFQSPIDFAIIAGRKPETNDLLVREKFNQFIK